MKKFLSRIMPMVLAVAIVMLSCPYGIIGAEAASVNHSLNFDDFASNIAEVDGLTDADGETRGKISNDADDAYSGFGFSTNATINANSYFFVKDGALGFRQKLPQGASTASNQRVTVALPTELRDAGKDYAINFKMKAWPQGYKMQLRFDSQENGNTYATDLGEIVGLNVAETSFSNYLIKIKNFDGTYYDVSLYKNGVQIGTTQDIAKARLKYVEFFWAAAYADRTYELLIDDLSVSELSAETAKLTVGDIAVEGITNGSEYNNQTHISASVEVENTDEELDVNMFIAYYEGDMLKTLKMQPLTINKSNEVQILRAETTLSPAQTGGYFKVFLFDKETLKPLTGAFATTAKQ